MGWPGEVPLGEDERLRAGEGRQVVRRCLAMLAPQKRAVVLTSVIMVAGTLCLLAGPVLVQYGIDEGVAKHRAGPLDLAAISYLVLSVLAVLLTRRQTFLVTKVGEELLRSLRVRVFDHILSLPMAFFDTEQTGRLVSRMTADVNALEDLVQQGLMVFLTNGVLIVVAVIVLLVLSPIMFALCLVSLPVLWHRSRRFKHESDRAYIDVRDRISATLSSLQEGISGVRVIQAFGREERQMQQFSKRNRAQLEANLRVTRIASWYFPIVELSGVVTVAVLVGMGGLLVHNGLVQVGTVVAFVLYVNNLYDPIQQTSQLFNLVQQSGAALHKLFGLLDTVPVVAEAPGAVDLERSGELEVRGVSFRYGGSEASAPYVLKDVSLVVRPGERVALVGPTGAGKSTLAKLMSRMYDPVEGKVTYAGLDLRKATTASLRQRIVVVPQEGFLFGGSVTDNVRLGRRGATDRDVRQAVELIGAAGILGSLSEGLDTQVQERGSRLSAGQRQLVSLARAALADPAVLVMDEATSSLDPGTEAEVEGAMSALMEGRTVILIAHRLSTAERADRVAVVDGGRLVEVGTHDELIARGGRYAALFASWLGAGGTAAVA